MARRSKKTKKGMLGRVAFAALVVLAVLALAFFLVLRSQNDISVAENMVGTVFSPIQTALTTATTYVRDLVYGVKDYFRMSDDLAAARMEINDLKLQLQTLEEAALENERLRELLDIKDRYESQDPLYARVIARDPGVWFDTFSINQGTSSGVAVNMAVITADGLVGRVYEVGLNYAKVISIIDSRSAVACLIERTRDNGVMRGQITANSTDSQCYMYYLPAVNDVSPGDTVITSGEDKLFPKGITVGTVTAVSRQQTDSSDRYIIVQPAVDFTSIEEVLVLRTVVETDDEQLAALPTPTPRPTPEATPTPEPTVSPDESALPGMDDVFVYPTPLPEGQTFVESEEGEDGQTAQPTDTPQPTINPENALPEDSWAA